ncbi:MAG: adenylate kinase [candidate division WOR-3 bacterium]
MNEKNGILLVLLGPPGSGKGTQAELLAQKIGFSHFSTGEVFRNEIKKGTPLGKKVREFVVSGGLVPDEVVLEVVAGFVKEKINRSIVFDGFPRTVPQAEGLDKLLSHQGLELTLAVLIDLSDEEVVRRLSSRRQCARCGKIYNLLFSPPKKEGVCDNCEGELYQRDDDREETIRQRLDVYKKQTAPLIEYYERQGKLHKIDGALGRDRVFELLNQLFNTLPKR